MQQRLELRRHDQVDEEDREQHRELQRAERLLHVVALAADGSGHADRHLDGADDALQLVDGRAEVARGEVRGHDRDALLAECAGSPRGRSRRVTSATAESGSARSLPGFTISVADLLDRGGARVDAAHQHVDLLVAQLVARRDVAAHAVRPRGRRCSRTARPSCAARSWSNTIWISGLPDSTVDLMSLNVLLACMRSAHLLGGLAQAVEVVAGDRDFERGREVEQRRPAELVLHAGEPVELGAQRVDRAPAPRAGPRRAAA